MAQQTFNGTKINVEFDESASRQQLNSGENISTLFGKIKKIFSDLKSVCFSGSYKDLSDTPTSLPASNVTDIYSATGTAPVSGKAVASAISNKVDKILGKGLSTNDLTATLKSNYDAAYTHSQSAHAPSSAQANVVETIKVNNTALTPTNKTVNITIPSNTDRYVNKAEFVDDSTATAASPVKMTLTRAGSDTNTITANIPKVSSSSAGVVPKGSAVSSQSTTTKFLREDGTWATPSYTTNTDTKVTAVGNHYTPAKSTTKSASGGTLTDITNSSTGTQVVTGVEMDAKGHVTGVTSVALKSSDTKVTVDSNLSSTSTNPVQNKAVYAALSGKANASHTHTVSQISDFPLYSNIDMFPELSDKSVVVFGDSIAAGYGITNNKHTWSNWLHNLGKMSQVENKAISNTTISRIDSNSITDQVISTDLSPFDYVIVAGGINDWQGQLSLDGFKQALTTMFDYLARYKAAKPYGNIIIISPINMCLANFKSVFGDCNQVLQNMNNGVSSISINKYRSIIEEYALRYEFTLIKGSEFDFPTVAGMKSNAYFIDGIHPSERGHYVYAMELLKNLCGYGDYKHFIPLRVHPDFEFPTGEYSSEGYIINSKTYYISSIAPSTSYTAVLLDNAININRTKLIRYNATAYFTIKGVVQQICIDSESLLGHLSLYQKSDGLYYAYQSHADVTNIDHLEITVYYTINDDISIHS